MVPSAPGISSQSAAGPNSAKRAAYRSDDDDDDDDDADDGELGEEHSESGDDTVDVLPE
jgi:hypothetical protein